MAYCTTRMRIAIVHEWLAARYGSERVVEQLLAEFPSADLFATVDVVPEGQRGFLHGKTVQTSFIQKLPFVRSRFRAYLPLMPLAIEQFDLSAYDVVISSHHAVAKGVLTRSHQLHLSYVHAPMRYAWDFAPDYAGGGLKGLLVRTICHYLRMWDVISANRVDGFIANSRTIAGRVRKCWRRPSQVVHPPVEVADFNPTRTREPFFCAVSRLVHYKRMDLVVEACNRLRLPLVVIGDGPDLRALRCRAGPTVQMLGWQNDAVVRDHLERCRAFITMTEEDFGIAPVEAMAAGAPVIAFGRGGISESVIAGVTGEFVPEQNADSLCRVLARWQQGNPGCRSEDCRARAEQFTPAIFRRRMRALVEKAWERFSAGDPVEPALAMAAAAHGEPPAPFSPRPFGADPSPVDDDGDIRTGSGRWRTPPAGTP